MRRHRVYPRASGGTAASTGSTYRPSGLSPRERGNRQLGLEPDPAIRSIPARAGEPCSVPPGLRQRRVYPRARRGNPRNGDRHHSGRRSIPARAGEPRTPKRWRWLPRVYPRASGGTLFTPDAVRPVQGLSPRERGNRRRVHVNRDGQRSIPARAGEPLSAIRSPRWRWVYPRASGGTIGTPSLEDAINGLSPRERGNRAY